MPCLGLPRLCSRADVDAPYAFVTLYLYNHLPNIQFWAKQSLPGLLVINKIPADFKYSFLFLTKYCCNFKKMKVYKNFDEIEENQENIRKIKRKIDHF